MNDDDLEQSYRFAFNSEVNSIFDFAFCLSYKFIRHTLFHRRLCRRRRQSVGANRMRVFRFFLRVRSRVCMCAFVYRSYIADVQRASSCANLWWFCLMLLLNLFLGEFFMNLNNKVIEIRNDIACKCRMTFRVILSWTDTDSLLQTKREKHKQNSTAKYVERMSAPNKKISYAMHRSLSHPPFLYVA